MGELNRRGDAPQPPDRDPDRERRYKGPPRADWEARQARIDRERAARRAEQRPETPRPSPRDRREPDAGSESRMVSRMINLKAQIENRDRRIDDLLAQREADHAEIADLRARLDDREARLDAAERKITDLESRAAVRDEPGEVPPDSGQDGPPPDSGGDGLPPDSGDGGDPPDPPDEPGSWRGDSGRYLDAEAHLEAQQNIDRIRGLEPRVTEKLRAIEADVPGASMVGLEFRLKGDDRLKDKIAKENRDNPAKGLRDISDDIADAIRYTYQFDAVDYTRGYHDVCARLEGEGYTLVHSVNWWDTPEYKGINTRWRTPDGPLFEVQFHTPESFATKQQTHDLYETVRNPALPQEVRAQARAEQRAISAGVPRPAGIETIENFKRQGY